MEETKGQQEDGKLVIDESLNEIRLEELNSYEQVQDLFEKQRKLNVVLAEKQKLRLKKIANGERACLINLKFEEKTPQNSLILLRDKNEGFFTLDLLKEEMAAGTEKELWLNYGKDLDLMFECSFDFAVLDLKVSPQSSLSFKWFKP